MDHRLTDTGSQLTLSMFSFNVFAYSILILTVCRCWAGIGGMNLALDIANNNSQITHVARLDDDDAYYPFHLQQLAQAYAMDTNIGFAFTQTSGFNNGRHDFVHGFPEASNTRTTYLPPTPCNLVHSSASWSLRHVNLRYRRDYEQFNTSRPAHVICGRAHVDELSVMAGDGDMWDRIYFLVENSTFSSVFLPVISVQYNTAAAKDILLRHLRKNYTWPYSAYHVYPPTSLSSEETMKTYTSCLVSTACEVCTQNVTIMGQSYGNGQYVMTTSSQFKHSDYLPEAFDENSDTQWSSKGNK